MKEWQNEKKTLETAASCPVTQLHNQMCARTSDNNNPSSKPSHQGQLQLKLLQCSGTYTIIIIITPA